jgi:hypothetical protein
MHQQMPDQDLQQITRQRKGALWEKMMQKGYYAPPSEVTPVVPPSAADFNDNLSLEVIRFSVSFGRLPRLLSKQVSGFAQLLHPPFLSRALASGAEAPETARVLSLLQQLPEDVLVGNIYQRIFAPLRELFIGFPR